MKDWMRGYQDWYDLDTERYTAAHAQHNADDRDRVPSLTTASICDRQLG